MIMNLTSKIYVYPWVQNRRQEFHLLEKGSFIVFVHSGMGFLTLSALLLRVMGGKQSSEALNEFLGTLLPCQYMTTSDIKLFQSV